MKKLMKNKGVAMVTVLITITFLGVLASSLMYMAYLNLLTKHVRIKSTDNFYTDEAALDEISVALQQVAMNAASLDLAKSAIKTKVGFSSGKYSPASVAAIASKTAAEGVTIECTTAPADAILVEGANSVTLKNVRLKTTSAKEGFVSTIQTDISINFLAKQPDGLNINDFSIITDDWIDVGCGSQIYEGNLYIENKNVTNRYFKSKVTPLSNSKSSYSGDTEASQYCSLWIHKGTGSDQVDAQAPGALTITSTYAIFVGDIVIQDNCALNLAGKNIAVFGNIYVGKHSSLCVTGNVTLYDGHLYVDGSKYDETRDKEVIGKKVTEVTGTAAKTAWNCLPKTFQKDASGNIVQDADGDDVVDKTPGLTSMLFDTFYVHSPSTCDTAIKGWRATSVGLYEAKYGANCNKRYKNEDTAISTIKQNFGSDDPFHAGDIENSLTILYRNKSTKVHGTNNGANGFMTNSTILTAHHLYYDANNNNDSFTGSMNEESYDTAYYSTFVSESENPHVSVTMTEVSRATEKKTGGTDPQFIIYEADDPNFGETVTSDLTNGNNNIKFADKNFKNEAEWLAFVEEKKKDKNFEVIGVQYGTDVRWFVYDTSTGLNYLPFGYLLSHKANAIIGDTFGFMKTGDDPENTYVLYKNWVKDPY